MPPSLLSAIDPQEHARIRKFLAPGLTPRALAAQEPTLGDEDGLGGKAESFGCLENSRYHPWIALLFNSVKAASFVAAVRFYPLLEWLLMKCILPSLKRCKGNTTIKSWTRDQKGDEGLEIGVINATFMVLTTAGSETTATVLSGTLNYLVNNPDKLAILTSEIRQRFKVQDEIKLDALRELEYLNACLNEGLRLSVPIPWMLPRLAPEGGATVCGTWLPGGIGLLAFTPPHLSCQSVGSPKQALTQPRHSTMTVAMQCSLSAPAHETVWGNTWLRLTMAKLLWNFDMEAVPDKRLRWEDMRTFLLVEKKPVLVRMGARH
ncbi:Isotrichodermin C-15 hydroxylase [Cytospora mali]|uniref:Isotrichodermin C-15 hydroxylase n=1 Tax=Cytospora mali TaxID=578113 RepID=A0A194W6R7_CYTMA|nr:Isotrichodermin C-15 hydroxylase [Valsa mali]